MTGAQFRVVTEVKIAASPPGDGSASPSADDLVAAAAKLAPMLAERAESCERDRRVSDEVIHELRAAGLLKLLVPSALGGLGAEYRTLMRVVSELAKACPSTAWVTGVLNGGLAGAAMLPEEGVAEVFGSSGPPLACGVNALTGTATQADDGYIVTGSWGFASGCYHAEWAFTGVRILDRDGNNVGSAFICLSMGDVAIEDTWRTAGMRGTGSNTLKVENLFVPARRVVLLPDAVARALQRSPLVPSFAASMVMSLLGIVESMLERVLANVDRRGITYTNYTKQVDSHAVLHALGEAAMAVDTAKLHCERAISTLDAERISGPMDFVTSARGQADVGTAVVALRRASTLLMGIAGASAYMETNPLQRAWRDFEVGSHHAMLNPTLGFELYGRILAGVAPNSPLWGPEARCLP